MKTVDNTVNLSQTKDLFEKYVTTIAKILGSKKVNMIKNNEEKLCWQSFRNKENCAKIKMNVFYHNISNEYCDVDLFILICYPSSFLKKISSVEKIIMEKTIHGIYKKYPLTNTHIQVTTKKPEIPLLPQEQDVAEQLCLALKSYYKITSPKTISKIKKVEKQIGKLIEKNADKITKSFFQ